MTYKVKQETSTSIKLKTAARRLTAVKFTVFVISNYEFTLLTLGNRPFKQFKLPCTPEDFGADDDVGNAP